MTICPSHRHRFMATQRKKTVCQTNSINRSVDSDVHRVKKIICHVFLECVTLLEQFESYGFKYMAPNI
jgi:hypothetical protein